MSWTWLSCGRTWPCSLSSGYGWTESRWNRDSEKGANVDTATAGPALHRYILCQNPGGQEICPDLTERPCDLEGVGDSPVHKASRMRSIRRRSSPVNMRQPPDGSERPAEAERGKIGNPGKHPFRGRQREPPSHRSSEKEREMTTPATPSGGQSLWYKGIVLDG